ncbi:hypothetical protein B0T22DRAFT_387304 [Podospora appendiculata]|uniref:non-specific serine/threonine protein kinase n=1 Tax=Podospora appendiculata TaxID=314037 RepID=A0AAE1C7I6_9PEZI|nr:hypothetical protein B0T22DRAFT_387304 [Podospora appendiculata]
MADQQQLNIINDNPIGNGLDSFRALYHTLCADRTTSDIPDGLGQLEQESTTVLAVLSTYLPSQLLPATIRRGTLRSDLLRLELALDSDDFNFDRIKPLLHVALADPLDDARIWSRVYDAATESTPPARPIPVATSLLQTPWSRNTSSFVNSSEYRKYVDGVLGEELGPMYVGLRDFHQTYFGGVKNLETASKTFFEACQAGSSPLFSNGWRSWPEKAEQDDVLSWFADFTEKLAAFAESYSPSPARKRRPLAQPDKPIPGSVAKRKMDIGFVDNPRAGKDSRCHWSEILVPGELKSNPSADIPSQARLDLGRYAREVIAAQDTRRFVLGFTLCGSNMRIWAFDRLGAVASEDFDINRDGLRFVSTILGFLWMNEEELGFDPTIKTEKGQRFIEIEREGTTERLILNGLMNRARCVAGRATTCWRAHREEDPHALFVVKDSWQYLERDEEGGLLREATSKGAVHVARYYHHETVQVRNADDDIRNNVRKGLDITKATNYRQNQLLLPARTSTPSLSRATRSSSSTAGTGAGAKRSSHETGALLPPRKRPHSTSSSKAGEDALSNRVHRRVIVSDYGIPIYKAASRQTLLTAMADCIEGHESLRQKAGLLHRDISIGNIMVSKDGNRGFLIDLDLAIQENRIGASGAKGKTGTRAFMAIGALLGKQHSFMHDLESFFWVLFWICIHYDGSGRGEVVAQFDKWNYADTNELAKMKLGTVAQEALFTDTMTMNFTPYYASLIPLLNTLRKVVFPHGNPWEREEEMLYSQMRDILQQGAEDLK